MCQVAQTRACCVPSTCILGGGGREGRKNPCHLFQMLQLVSPRLNGASGKVVSQSRPLQLMTGRDFTHSSPGPLKPSLPSETASGNIPFYPSEEF